MTSVATTTRLGPASPAQIERAREADEMYRLAEALPPDLRAAFHRANAVLNTMTAYRAVLLSADPMMMQPGPRGERSLKAKAEAGINAAWEALAGQGVTEASRVALMRAVDAAVKAGGGVDAVLAELPPELVVRLEPRRDALGAVVTAWPRTKAGRGAGKWRACADLWQAATRKATTPASWQTLWSRCGNRRRNRN